MLMFGVTFHKMIYIKESEFLKTEVGELFYDNIDFAVKEFNVRPLEYRKKMYLVHLSYLEEFYSYLISIQKNE